MAHTFNARLFVIAIFGSILILFSYFTASAEEKPVAEKKIRATRWFDYTGPGPSDPNYNSEILDATNYQAMSTPGCTTGNQVCAVQVEEESSSSDHPNQDALTAISAQLLKQEAQDLNIVRFEN